MQNLIRPQSSSSKNFNVLMLFHTHLKYVTERVLITEKRSKKANTEADIFMSKGALHKK